MVTKRVFSSEPKLISTPSAYAVNNQPEVIVNFGRFTLYRDTEMLRQSSS